MTVTPGKLNSPDECMIALCQLVAHAYRERLQRDLLVHVEAHKTAGMDPLEHTGVIDFSDLILQHLSATNNKTELAMGKELHRVRRAACGQEKATLKAYMQLVFGETINWEGMSVRLCVTVVNLSDA
jgi:hypothetical protein